MNRHFRNPDIFTRREAAEYLGICLTTLGRLDVPKTRMRNRVFFKRDVLNKWIDDNTHSKKKGKQ